MSQGLKFTSSLKHRKPAYASRHATTNLKSKRERLFPASLTISSNMTGVTGAFFDAGFASNLYKPSSVAFTNGDTVGDDSPAVECTHATELQASSIADLDCVLSAKSWR